MNRYKYADHLRLAQQWDLYHDGTTYHLVTELYFDLKSIIITEVGTEKSLRNLYRYNIPEHYKFMGNVGGKFFKDRHGDKYMSGYDIDDRGIQLQNNDNGIKIIYTPLDQFFRDFKSISRKEMFHE